MNCEKSLEVIENGCIHSHTQEGCICVFWKGNKPLYRGCIDAVLDFSDDKVNEWLITRVLVQPQEARRTGIGRLMMNRFKEEAKRLGVTKAIVAPSGYDMSYAEQVAFYEAQGFVKEETAGGVVLVWKPE